MPIEIIDAAGKLLQLKLRGMFKKADYDRMIQIAKKSIEREGKVCVLIIFEAFEGWERHEDWGDVSFMSEEVDTSRKWRSSAMKNGKTTRLLLQPRGFVPRPSSSSRRRA